MKERPILFSGPMVRALLSGTKTQTRRVVKPRHDRDIGCELAPNELAGEVNSGSYRNAPWAPGDRLWVRETFAGPLVSMEHWEAVNHPSEIEKPEFCEYAADGGPAPEYMDADDNLRRRWTPSIHMPRWASRITLEVTGVRVERLQDISAADAIAEGIERLEDFFGCPCWKAYGEPEGSDLVLPDDPIGSYRSLWESINGLESWEGNPRVWVVEFRRIVP